MLALIVVGAARSEDRSVGQIWPFSDRKEQVESSKRGCLFCYFIEGLEVIDNEAF